MEVKSDALEKAALLILNETPLNRTGHLSSQNLSSGQKEALDFCGEILAVRKNVSLPPEDADVKEATVVMKDFCAKNAAKALRQADVLERRIEEHKLLRDEVLHAAKQEGREISNIEYSYVQKRNDKIVKLQGKLDALPNFNPDAFFALHAKSINEYADQLKVGRLVETPYVKEKLAFVVNALMNNRAVLVHGETGSGKTELAKLAARKFSKLVTGEEREPLLVRGYPWMTSEELFGHQVLKSSNRPISEVTKEIEIAIWEWKGKNPGADDKQTEKAEELITKKALYTSGVTVSEFVLGMMYEAARDNRVVILDEANYIPPGLLAKINESMTLKAGDYMRVQEDGLAPILIPEGFGILETANLNYAMNFQRYGNRFEFDTAHINRVKPTEYDYLDQNPQGNWTDVLDPKEKQLFTICIATLVGRDGGVIIPKSEIEVIWKLAQYAKITQMAFSGLISDSHAFAFQKGAASIGVNPNVVMSPRTLQAILSDWKADGFQYELDSYLYENFICSAVKLHDKAYLYQVAQKFGFFQSIGWERNVPYDQIDKLTHLQVKDPKNFAGSVEVVPNYRIIEAIYGSAPVRTEWPVAELSKLQKQNLDVAEAVRLGVEIEDIGKDLDNLLKLSN